LQYLRKLQFNGNQLFQSPTKTLKDTFNNLKIYLDDIRKFDWCRENGTAAYQARQDAFLKQATTSEKARQKKEDSEISKNKQLQSFVISQKSYLLQAYRNEQLTTERCSCFSVARVSYNYNKDPEPQFNSFASMCSKVPGCVKKASLKDVIDKQKQQAKSSNGSKSSKNGTKKKGSKKSKKAKKASKKAKKASKKKHVPKSFSSQREIPVPPKKN